LIDHTLSLACARSLPCPAQVITTLATTAVISVLWANIEPLMLAVGQSEVIALGAARYLRLAIPALLLTGMSECLKRYLQAQVRSGS
jgi:Na+-driven multidrug efflux pump